MEEKSNIAGNGGSSKKGNVSRKLVSLKRNMGVQPPIKHVMPDISAVSPKIDRKGIKIVHPDKTDHIVANYKRPTFEGLQAKIDNKGINVSRGDRASLASSLLTGLNHDMPNIKGIKHKVDTKGTDLAKLPPSPSKLVHQGLPYNKQDIRAKVGSWRYQFLTPGSLALLPRELERAERDTSTQTVSLRDSSVQVVATQLLHDDNNDTDSLASFVAIKYGKTSKSQEIREEELESMTAFQPPLGPSVAIQTSCFDEVIEVRDEVISIDSGYGNDMLSEEKIKEATEEDDTNRSKEKAEEVATIKDDENDTEDQLEKIKEVNVQEVSTIYHEAETTEDWPRPFQAQIEDDDELISIPDGFFDSSPHKEEQPGSVDFPETTEAFSEEIASSCIKSDSKSVRSPASSVSSVEVTTLAVITQPKKTNFEQAKPISSVDQRPSRRLPQRESSIKTGLFGDSQGNSTTCCSCFGYSSNSRVSSLATLSSSASRPMLISGTTRRSFPCFETTDYSGKSASAKRSPKGVQKIAVKESVHEKPSNLERVQESNLREMSATTQLGLRGWL